VFLGGFCCVVGFVGWLCLGYRRGWGCCLTFLFLLLFFVCWCLVCGCVAVVVDFAGLFWWRGAGFCGVRFGGCVSGWLCRWVVVVLSLACWGVDWGGDVCEYLFARMLRGMLRRACRSKYNTRFGRLWFRCFIRLRPSSE